VIDNEETIRRTVSMTLKYAGYVVDPAVVVNLIAVHSFAHTKGANTVGIYRYSRNPMYVGTFHIFVFAHSKRLVSHHVKCTLFVTAVNL